MIDGHYFTVKPARGILFQQYGIHALTNQIADHSPLGIDLIQAFDTAMSAVTDQILTEVAEQDRQFPTLRPGHGGTGDDGPPEQTVRCHAGEILNPDIPAACRTKLANHRRGHIMHQIHAVIAVLPGNAVLQLQQIIRRDFSFIFRRNERLYLTGNAQRLALAVTKQESLLLRIRQALTEGLRNEVLDVEYAILSSSSVTRTMVASLYAPSCN